MEKKHVFWLILGIIGIWFLYSIRSVLTPFVIAGIFAYIFNPVINFIYKNTKLPRSIVLSFIFILIIGLIAGVGFMVTRQVSIESIDLNKIIQNDLKLAKNDIKYLSPNLRPIANDLIDSAIRSRFLAFFQYPYRSVVFSRAISEIISFFIFIFATFYLLKDGEIGVNKIINLFSENTQRDLKNLINKINNVLGDYLRGELALVVLVSAIIYISLLILGLRFALMVAVFSGFAEIVPVIGPITAGAIAVIVMLLTGNNNFGLNPLDASIVIILIYFIIRQIEDYLVIPHLMGKITKIHPFLIFFAVVAGGKIAGILGLILAVPLIAVLRLLVLFYFRKNPLGRE